MAASVYYFRTNPSDPLANAHLYGEESLSAYSPELNLSEINLAGGACPPEKLDLLIVEDNLADLTGWLLPSALAVTRISSIGICSSLQALNRLVDILHDAPKVMTLDFELRPRGRTQGESTIPETHQLVRKLLQNPHWKHGVIVGITYHSRNDISKELLDDLHAGGHSVFEKSSFLKYVLPDVLWDALGKFSMRVQLGALETVVQSIRSDDPAGAVRAIRPPAIATVRAPRMKAIVDAIRRVVHLRQAPVLLLGESGVGKTTIAQELLHTRGEFVDINCSTFEAGLLESQLFGHVKGAFTDAVKDKQGLLEVADGGTLFLDEIGTLPLALQPKLLTALTSGVFLPVGATKAKRVKDVRLVAATNADLATKIRKGEFRDDLYFRLSALTFTIPGLRERREDIPDLVRFLLPALAQENAVPAPQITDDAVARMSTHDYEGNVWGLRNTLIQLMAKDPDTITLDSVDTVLGSRNTQVVASAIHFVGPSYDDGLEHLRVRIDQIEGYLQLGHAPHEIGRAVLGSRNNPTQRLGGFWRQETTVRVFRNMPEKDVQERWPKVLEDLRVKRKSTLRSCDYPEWMLPVAAFDAN